MTKFRTDVTKGGYKILSIHGPDIEGCYGGVVERPDGDFIGCTWGRYGVERDGEEAYYLIPLDEPKPNQDLAELLDHTTRKAEANAQHLLDLQKRIEEVHKDAVARVNGLRADYLADKDAVQPSRLDALEERVEDAHETAAFANQKVVAWTDRVEALETRLNKNDSEFVKLDHLTKETDRHLNTVGDLAQHACLQGVKLNQRLEALEQRTQPSDTKILKAAQALVDAIANQVNTHVSWKDMDLFLAVPGYLLEGVRPLFKKGTQTSDAGAGVKGVWVTAEQFWDAWCEVNPIGLTSEEVYRRIAKRLGLEE